MLMIGNRYRWIGVFLGGLLFFSISNAISAQKAVLDGLWLQIDDRDWRPRSIVRVRSDGELVTAKVEEIFLPPGVREPLCDHCEGGRAGRQIRGMEILSVSLSGEQEWKGKVFDPVSGKEYSCQLKLDASGKLLFLRGYIGIPAVGRTQVWRRFGTL